MSVYRKGLKDGIPIALGYFAVSFAFGIAAAKVGMHALQATLLSLMNVTSAGQLAALDVIAQKGSYFSMILLQLVINMRYFLMSASLSQRVDPSLPLRHRLGIAYGVTDEIFALSAVYPAPLAPRYTYGLISVAVPGWCLGTFLGAAAGEILPVRVISALGVAIYGMFLAIIIPETREKRPVLFAVGLAMAMSLAFTYLPVLRALPSGYRIIVITVAVGLFAAAKWPIEESGIEENEENGSAANVSQGAGKGGAV